MTTSLPRGSSRSEGGRKGERVRELDSEKKGDSQIEEGVFSEQE